MSANHHDDSRRRFLRAGLMGAAAVPVAGLLGGLRTASAQTDMPKLSEDDPAAKALNYHEDASEVSGGARSEGAICANCQLYQGSPDSEWGGCGAFPGKAVAANGWCSAWVEAA